MRCVHSKQYACMCHECGKDIMQYVSQFPSNVKVTGQTKAFLSNASSGCRRHLFGDYFVSVSSHLNISYVSGSENDIEINAWTVCHDPEAGLTRWDEALETVQIFVSIVH